MGKKRGYVKNRREGIAVTEVVGTMLLLLISVTFFSIVYVSVLSTPSSSSTPSANIACTIVGNKIVLDHFGGDSLDLETKLIMTIGGVSVEKTVGNINSTLSWDENNDQKWNMGEQLVYIPGDLTDKQVEIRIVDVESNSLVMMGILHEGISSVPSLATSVDGITPYNQTHSPFTITSNGDSALDNVTLWYRYSTNNASGSWSDYSSFDTDPLPSWQWSFDFPGGTGYYEFYSIGMYSGDEEGTPASADTMCFYNQAPEISNPYPANESVDIPAIPTLNITVSDADGNPMNITWYGNSSGSWQIFGTNTSVSNGTYHQTNNNFSNYGEIYYWYVSASDGGSAGNSPIYHFTTEPIDTWVDSVSTTSPYEITASGPSDLSNVTLWYRYSSNNWSYYRTITIDHTKVDENLANFPVLVEIDSTIGSKCDDGDSIRFFDVDNSTEYYYEIEHWDGSGNSYVWVKIPSVSATEDTVFLMHYNSSEASDNQHPENVWDSNYMMVQHLEETTGIIGDSTSYENDGTAQNGVILDAMGQIDGADSFDGSNDYILIPDDSSLDGNGNWPELTMEAWITPDVSQTRKIILAKWGSSSSRSYEMGLDSVGNTQLFAAVDNGAFMETIYSDVDPLVPGTWYHVAATYKNGTLDLYINGVLDATASNAGGNIKASSDSLKIGARNPSPERFIDGSIDEVRISDVARDRSWIIKSYENQNNPSSFLTIGSEQSITGDTSWTEFETDTASGDGWSWNFDFSNGTGYYEFYSIGKKAGSVDEIAPGVADATCRFAINSNPYTPSNPSPADESIEVSVDADLSWTGGDPDGDSVTYDIYFGTASPPPKIVSNQSGTSYDPGTMNNNQIYYWKIVAWDDHSVYTEGPTWKFATELVVTTLNPTKDTYICVGYPNLNYGSQYQLRVGYSYTQRSLVEFDLSSLFGKTVISAEFKLYKYDQGGSNPIGRTYNAHRITKSWKEMSVKWNNRPSYYATSIDGDTVPVNGNWMVWNVTNDVQDFADGTYTNYGWLIKDEAEPSGYCYSFFRSREYSNANYRPVLEVTYQ